MPRPLGDHDFDANYYATGCGRPYGRDQVWLDFFGRIADRIATDLVPGRTLDAGCAWGLLVEALRGRGVDAWGFDISSHAIAQVTPAVRPYCWQASATDEIEGRYDLIICMEIFPHLTPEDGRAAIANFCRHSDTVLFSSSPCDPIAPRHRNTFGPDAWASVFLEEDFVADRSRDLSVMTPWATVFRRRTVPRGPGAKVSALLRRLLANGKQASRGAHVHHPVG
jgi:hypothetical protein